MVNQQLPNETFSEFVTRTNAVVFNPCCQMCKAPTPKNVTACDGCKNYKTSQRYG